MEKGSRVVAEDLLIGGLYHSQKIVHKRFKEVVEVT